MNSDSTVYGEMSRQFPYYVEHFETFLEPPLSLSEMH